MKLAEGKTKIIRADPEDSTGAIVMVESKNDITAGDGAKHDMLEGKAVSATTTTCNVFELLDEKGVQTHYLGRVDDRTFRAHKTLMIPIEIVVRRLATGSYLKRHPEAVEGEVFNGLVFEAFHKDDANRDPILRFDFDRGVAVRYPPDEREETAKPINKISLKDLGLGLDGASMMRELEAIAREVFTILESAWADQDVQLVDLKMECGWADFGLGLVVADVIDNDSWRIWPAGDKTQMLDKQVYRDLAVTDDPAAKAKELGRIKDNYEEVAQRTERFVK